MGHEGFFFWIKEGSIITNDWAERGGHLEGDEDENHCPDAEVGGVFHPEMAGTERKETETEPYGDAPEE